MVRPCLRCLPIHLSYKQLATQRYDVGRLQAHLGKIASTREIDMNARPTAPRGPAQQEFIDRLNAVFIGTRLEMREFAARFDRSHSTVSNVLAGRDLLSRRSVERVAEEFGCKDLVALWEEARKERRDRQAVDGGTTPATGPEGSGLDTDDAWRADSDVHFGLPCPWIARTPARKSFAAARNHLRDSQPDLAACALREGLAVKQREPDCDICFAWAHSQLGEIAFGDGRHDDGRRAFQQAMQSARATPQIRAHYADRLARLLLEAGGDHVDQASREINLALTADQGSGLLWRRHGIVHWHQRRLHDARLALEHARTLGVPEVQLACVTGQVLLELGRAAEAFDVLSLGLVDAPGEFPPATVYSARAWACACLGHDNAARADFGRAQELAPDNSWLHHYRARYDNRAPSEAVPDS